MMPKDVMMVSDLMKQLRLSSPLFDAIEKQEQLRRMLEPMGGLSAVMDQIQHRQTAYDQVLEVYNRSQEFRQLAEHLSAGDKLSDIARQMGGSALADARAAIDQWRTPLGFDGIAEILRVNRLGSLEEYLPPRRDLTAAIAAAASAFDHLGHPENFARVGAASFAAADAYNKLGAFSPALDRLVDPFFGDWTRSPDLPQRYGDDDGAREEIVEEIGADKALLDVSPEEAGSIIQESVLEFQSQALFIFGRPSGLALVQSPGTVVFEIVTEFERRLRARVDRVMTKAHGSNWIANKFPEEHRSWTEKREADAKERLETHDLIQYSDFTELAKIVVTHWTDGFEASGVKPRDIKRCVMAMNPHRRYTMHSRIVRAEQVFGVFHQARKLEAWLMEDEPDE